MGDQVCPNCAHEQLYSRMTKTPKFRCAECGTETDTAAGVPEGLTVEERKCFLSDSDGSEGQIQCTDCGGSLEENTESGSPYVCVDCGSEYTVPPVVDDEDTVSADTTEACPECNSAMIDKRTTKTPTYRCNQCKNTFDDPVVRRVKRKSDSESSVSNVKVKCLSCKNVTLQARGDSRYKCIQCGSSQRVDTAQEYQIITASEVMQKLANGPVVPDSNSLGTTSRGLANQVKLPSSKRNPDWGANKSTVYYLPGDERAALRLFAREHPDEMQTVFESSQSDKLSQTWPDEKINMLRQAWLAVRDEVLAEDNESEDSWAY